MNVISDLGNELAMAVLVEKKHREKINSLEALNLIRKVQAVLQTSAVSDEEVPEALNSPEKEDLKMSAH